METVLPNFLAILEGNDDDISRRSEIIYYIYMVAFLEVKKPDFDIKHFAIKRILCNFPDTVRKNISMVIINFSKPMQIEDILFQDSENEKLLL